MKIRFYGRLGELVGREIDVDIAGEGMSVAALRERLAAQFPAASADIGRRSRACVADAIVGEGHLLAAGDTVEFFPPLSGG